MILIYDYIDYRRYLSDKVGELRKQNKHFSYRLFNRMAGIQSSGFLKLVMDGKRNLGPEGIFKIAKGFKLSEEEHRFFEKLVHMNQASTHEEKDRCFRELSKSGPFLKSKPLTALQYNLFSGWHYVALLELVRVKGVVSDPAWMSQHLNPTVELKKVKSALKELMELGLLSEDKQGNIRRTEAMIATADEVVGMSLVNFHREMCERACNALLNVSEKDREFSSLTIAVPKKDLEIVKKKIQSFRKELHSLLEREVSEKEVVVQINLQMFPLSKAD